MSTPTLHQPSRSDRVILVAYSIIGALIVLWGAFTAYFRIMRVLLGEDIPVRAHLFDIQGEVPIGPGGASVPVEANTVTLSVPQLPGDAVSMAILQHVVLFLGTAMTTLCLILLARNTVRGRIFGRSSSMFLVSAAISALLGFGVSNALEKAVASSVLREISNDTLPTFMFETSDTSPSWLVVFAAAVILTAYGVGARIQRDQEGLV